MSSFLAEMAEGSRRRARPAASRMETLRAQVAGLSPPRPISGFGEQFDLIAEIKPRSPAVGRLPERDPVAQAQAYVAGGAAVLSVLTEPEAFGGSIEMLEQVAARSTVPVMAKDFLVHPAQVYQARAAGADGVLLIGRLLDGGLLEEMVGTVAELGMFPLLEAFDESDLDRLLPVSGGGTTLLGVNCRDLDTLEVVPQRHLQLLEMIPAGLLTVAESGVSVPERAQILSEWGYRGVLVGSALMQSGHPVQLVRGLLEAGRRGVVAPTR